MAGDVRSSKTADLIDAAAQMTKAANSPGVSELTPTERQKGGRVYVDADDEKLILDAGSNLLRLGSTGVRGVQRTAAEAQAMRGDAQNSAAPGEAVVQPEAPEAPAHPPAAQ